MEALDRYREALGQPATGLTDDFRLLSAGLAPTRDARRFYLGELLDSHPDPVVEKLARHALDADDDAAAADQLLDRRSSQPAGERRQRRDPARWACSRAPCSSPPSTRS